MTTKGVSEVEDLHYNHVVYKFRSPTGHKVVDSEVQLGCTAYINADRVPCRLAGAVLSWRTRKSGRTRWSVRGCCTMVLYHFVQAAKELPWYAKGFLGCVICSPLYFVKSKFTAMEKRDFHRNAITDKVYLDLSFGHEYAGRVLIGLYGQQVPLTCENFLQLCRGYQVGDKTIGYKNTKFHRILPQVALLGGDVVTGTGASRGMSIYGESFPDENFNMDFIQDGDVAMASWGPNTNSSQFMITLIPATTMFGKHVVFGTVLKGMKVIHDAGALGTKTGVTVRPIYITQCGVYDEANPPPPPEGYTNQITPPMSEDDFETEWQRAKVAQGKPAVEDNKAAA
eukprot:CAMPEP_0204263018 /NCGR_PEP_ID=MMETSP0468-20130131/8059_1 /ASSEMBLY_ACC=CAM_ASM_000383 /TAXON_ID=2969 /ORGANISM="Oxyrrhis marina" /LENGTH=339 /DNA_ID=CAMNT_0051237735 /DNA_START=153 /DNA_END=1172 /DNA_ORIENTATION=-